MSKCPVCDLPVNEPCDMCAQSMAMILSLTLPKVEPEAMAKPAPAHVAEEAQALINICSGEDVCLS